MFHTIPTALATEGMQRVTLLINHVLASESVGPERLRPHVGRCILLRLEGWPSLLPPPPNLAFRITSAALVEWCGEQVPEQVDLQVTVDASNPAMAILQALGGERPKVDVSGDAVLATDVNWLFANLRWDIEDDLAKVVGPAVAHEMARLGKAMAGGLRDAVGAVGGLAARARRAGPAG